MLRREEWSVEKRKSGIERPTHWLYCVYDFSLLPGMIVPLVRV